MKLTKNQRMQMKGFGCVVMLFLLLLFLILGLIQMDKPSQEQQSENIPEIQLVKNAWILNLNEESLTVFQDGEWIQYTYSGNIAELKTNDSVAEKENPTSFCLADLIIMDGEVTNCIVKKERISGVIKSVSTNFVELEKLGKIPFDEEYRGYRAYGEPQMCGWRDLIIGYNFADFILDDGKISGFFLAREPKMEDIRVLIKTSFYQDIYHEKLEITGNGEFSVCYQKGTRQVTEVLPAGENLTVDKESYLFEKVGDRVVVEPETNGGRLRLLNVERNDTKTAYSGKFELVLSKEGILLINHLSLEEYLYAVVPSEMPASYPRQALMAQTICARTYAYDKMLHAGYPEFGAHLDDSTAYQVYHNVNMQDSTTDAVKATHGQILLTPENVPAETYYYSTSCGRGTDIGAWQEQPEERYQYLVSRQINRKESDKVDTPEEMANPSADFLLTIHEEDYEKDQPWYRWSYAAKDINVEEFQERLAACLEMQGEGEMAQSKELKAMEVTKRASGGAVKELKVVTDAGVYSIKGERAVRTFLCDGKTAAIRMDGKEVLCENLLPSAFFLMETSLSNGKVVGYTLIGGGYGHGIGMSQNGAGKMAKEGWTAEEILDFFYQGCRVTTIY